MGSSSAKSTSTTTTSIDPTIQNAAYKTLQQGMEGAQGYHAIAQAMPTGFTPEQQKAFDLVNNLSSVTEPYAQKTAALSDQISAFKPKDVQYQGFTPAQVTGTYEYTPTASADKMKQMVDDYYSQVRAPDLTFMKDFANSNSGVDLSGISWGGGGNAEAAKAEAAKVNRGDIRDVSAGMTPELLQKYMAAADPSYSQPLIDSITNQLDRSRKIALQQGAGSAASAGAFGGSRQGVVEAETNRAFLDSVANQTGQIRLKTYEDMLGALQADLDRQLKADTGNQGMDAQIALGNAGFQQQSNITNAQNATSTSVANAQMAAQARAAQAAAQAQAAMAKYNMQGSLLGQYGSLLSNQYGLNLTAARDKSTLVGNALTSDTNALNDAAKYAADARFGADKFNVDQSNSSRLAQSQLDLQGQQNNAGNWQNYGAWLNDAAKTQSLLGTNAMNDALTQANALFSSGEVQRLMGDQQQAVAYQNQLNEMLAPYIQAMLMQGALSVPYGTTTQSNAETVQTPSLMQQIGQGVSGLASLSSLFKSDERLKRDVKPIRGALGAVHRMKGVQYKWREDGRPDTGLLAQDVEKAVPNGVIEMDGVKHVSAPAVLGLLTSAVQELDKKISRKRRAS